VLPLYEVLGGRKSQQFPAVSIAAAYEISLDEQAVLAGAVPIELPASSPATAERLPTIGDFADLLDHASPEPPLPSAADERARSLPRIPLLSSLSPADLRHVIERVALRDCVSGDVILREGEPGGSLFVVVSGRVQVVGQGPPARELASLGEGAFFGELALLTDFPRSATVVAREPTQLIEISRELVSEIVRRSPEVLKTLLRFFRDRLLDRLLASSALFSSFAPDQARALAERFVFLELEPGMRVIVEGERVPGLFVLLCGVARVTRGAAEMTRLGPGDVFGEISLLGRGPATATIETHTKCWALELPREQFQEIMVTYPQILEYVSDVAERRKQQNLHVDFL
jgi:CRP-like cAMP-binding protein